MNEKSSNMVWQTGWVRDWVGLLVERPSRVVKEGSMREWERPTCENPRKRETNDGGRKFSLFPSRPAVLLVSFWEDFVFFCTSGGGPRPSGGKPRDAGGVFHG